MILTLTLFLVLSLVSDTLGLVDPTITPKPNGLEFKYPDAPGITMVAIHLSVNKPLPGVGAGDYAMDITSKTGTDWVYTFPVQVHPGDTVNYWMFVLQNGQGSQLLDRSWTYAAATTTRATTSRPTTHATTAHTTASAAQVNENPGATAAPQAAAGTGTGTGTSAGGGAIAYGPGIYEGFVDDRTCTSYPCLIFEDNFDFINHKIWEHEITAGGGGNWEFQYYTNNRTNSYTRDGILYLKPTLTSDHFGMEYMEHGSLDLWGGSAADVCTGNMFWGCKRDGAPGRVINPIQSARLRSSRGLNFRYGKVEAEAKLPVGDWLWPAIWMLPRLNVYGQWPASGEIDIMESRGNRNYHNPQGTSLGVDSMGSTLHFGADFFTNRWPTAHAEKIVSSGTYADDFHRFAVNWDDQGITFYVDDEEILKVEPDEGGMWVYGGLDQIQGYDNPWAGSSRMAPFDEDFYLIINLAVGGTGFFDDKNTNSPTPKPWQDTSDHAMDQFWGARNQWYPTWNPTENNGEDAALKVNYIRVWKTKPDPK